MSKHFAFIAEMPCLACGRSPVQVAHVRYSEPRAAKVNPGIGRKDDEFVVPLCHDCHLGSEGQHASGERRWWAERGINPVWASSELKRVSGDHELGKLICRAWAYGSGD
jgi:hypothetical protein